MTNDKMTQTEVIVFHYYEANCNIKREAYEMLLVNMIFWSGISYEEIEKAALEYFDYYEVDDFMDGLELLYNSRYGHVKK